MQTLKRFFSIKYLIIFIETCCSIGFLAFLADKEHMPLLIAPFGATAAIAFGLPYSRMGAVSHIFCGHFLSAIIGITCSYLLGNNWYSVTIGLSLAIIVMLMTNTMHPPGAATAVLCIIERESWSFLIMPLGLGLTVLIIICCLGKCVLNIIDNAENNN